MPLDQNGNWVPSLFPKQFQVFNNRARFQLVSGPRKSGKSIACEHRVARHLWEIDKASVAVIAKTVKVAAAGGVWDDITKIVIPEWIESGIGMEWATWDGNKNPGPKIDNSTKAPYFRVTNMHGTESQVYLFSLDVADVRTIESKIKQTRFSCIYFPELSNFTDRGVFTTTVPSLRMMHLAREDHLWIADTNPSDEGTESWIYKIWYEERIQEDHPRPNFQKDLSLIEIFCHDNPYFTEADKEELMALCAHDQELYDRYVNGLWVAGGNAQRHFANAWQPSIHLLGDASSPDKDKWETILPSPDCYELCTGWDMGDTNHSFHIVEPQRKDDNPKIFSVLDELVYVGSHVSTEDFTLECLAKMEAIEKMVGRPVIWRHWSDDSALKQWKASINGLEAMLVRSVSNGKILLMGAPKEPGSVIRRVSLTKKLLIHNRLFVSAHCFATAKMFMELRKGRNDADYVKRSDNPHKHPFDSLSYILQMECIDEINNSATPQTGNRTGLILAA